MIWESDSEICQGNGVVLQQGAVMLVRMQLTGKSWGRPGRFCLLISLQKAADCIHKEIWGGEMNDRIKEMEV